MKRILIVFALLFAVSASTFAQTNDAHLYTITSSYRYLCIHEPIFIDSWVGYSSISRKAEIGFIRHRPCYDVSSAMYKPVSYALWERIDETAEGYLLRNWATKEYLSSDGVKLTLATKKEGAGRVSTTPDNKIQ